MKRLIVLMSCAVLLSGCAAWRTKSPMPAWKPHRVSVGPEGGIERMPFRSGVSAVTVEKMAAAAGCTGGQGASLITEPGPVEVYRMICANRQTYLARCEFRQCKAMAPRG